MNSKNKSNRSLIPKSARPLARIIHIALALTATIIPLRQLPLKGQSLLLSRPLTLRWDYPSSSISSVTPAKDVDATYLPLTGGEIVSLRIKDGQLVWKTDVGGDVLVTPTADSERLYVANEVRDEPADRSKARLVYIRSISRSSGVILWFHSLPQTVRHVHNSDASALFTITSDSVVIGVDKSTGAVRWSSQLSSRIVTAPIFHNHLLYLALEDGEVVTLRQEDGLPISRYRTRDHITTLLLAADAPLYSGTAEGYVNALSETAGSLTSSWRKRVGAEIQSINLTLDGLLVVSRDNSVTFLKRQTGKRLWKRHLPDRLAVQPLLVGDAALFAPLGEDACIVLSLRDGKQVNTLYLGKNNSVVASPIVADDYLLVPTRLGLLAFTNSGQ
jgi:outer membrane protein assembly factor BamB